MSKSQFFKNALSSLLNTVIRFPFETITSFIALATSITFSEAEYDSIHLNLYTKILLICSLCLVGFLNISIYFSSRKKGLVWLISNLAAGSLLVFFVFQFSEKLTDTDHLQFIVLNIALHLLVSFVAFINQTYQQNHFWEFNKQLFMRLFTAALYSFVLFGGLAVALLAITELFHVEFYNKIYFHLWLVIIIVFNTLFFLAGIPTLKSVETELVLNYPKGLKKFTLYVLLPLLLIYLVILLGYEMKIVFTLTLPLGWVSYLILIFSIFGLLSFLLVYPISQQKENLWIYSFNRWFYFVLIPLIGLLFWAILYRINLYGITPSRYYVLLLAIWLSVVVVYFIFKKEAKIKFIPISLFIAALFSISGPQSANSISKNSQQSRFETYLKIMEHKKLSFSQEKDMSSIVDFLFSNFGIKAMQPLAKGKLDELAKAKYTFDSPDIMEALGTKYVSRYETKTSDENEINYYNPTYSDIENIHGYDFKIELTNYRTDKINESIVIDNQKYMIQTNKKEYGFDLIINQNTIPIDLLSFIVSEKAKFKKSNPDVKIIQFIDLAKYQIKIKYESVNAQLKPENKKITNYNIKMLVKIKS